MNPVGMGARSGLVMIVVAVMLYGMFVMSSLAGVEASQNESVTFTEIKQNVSSIDNDVHDGLTDDYPRTGPYLSAGTSQMMQASVGSSVWGLKFGYNYPHAAQFHAAMSPFIVLAALHKVISTIVGKIKGLVR